jgi:hypothetical protein
MSHDNLDPPKQDNLPAIGFGVDVPQTLANIFGVPVDKKWMGIDVGVNIVTTETDISKIRTSVTSIILNNTLLLCPNCEEMYPVFQKITVDTSPVSTTRRRLRAVNWRYVADYYILLVFQYQVRLLLIPPCARFHSRNNINLYVFINTSMCTFS